MTPEGSENLVELQSSEEDQSAVPSSSSNSVQLRVKNVCEINSNEAESNSSSPPKRKLPSWMLASSQENSSSNKRRKTRSNQNETATTGSDDGQPESSDIHSTSERDVQNDTAGQDDGLNDVNAKANEKEEDEVNGEPSDEQSATECSVASTSNGQVTPGTTIKTEPVGEEDNIVVGHITPTSPKDIKPAVKVEKEEATSTTTRPTCRFGIRCYRQNPMHRREEAHPGDKDYRRPDFPTPPDGTPDCPFGDLCYRRNPVHFQQYSHPPSTDFEQNYTNYKMRLRKRKQSTIDPNSSYSDFGDEEDDYDLEDPFIDDGEDDEFVPSDDDNDDDDDDF